MIKTTGYSQTDMLLDILSLHVKKGIDIDPTYGRGNFYKDHRIKQPKFKFDLHPRFKYVAESSADNLPIIDESMRCVMFDPPFLATKGKSLDSDKGNVINRHFGVFETETALHEFYVQCLYEFYRILRKNGILIFKCQDKVSSGKQYFSHTFIQNTAENVGFYTKDLFILLAKNRIVADWQKRNQQHARKYHCYFWVFQKSDKTVRYVT